MRINKIQNSHAFGKLFIQENKVQEFSSSILKQYEQRLSKTKHVDLIIDSQGFAIKEKMTDILQRIQSFSLFPEENAVGVNVNDGKNNTKTYKTVYKTLDKAKDVWKDLYKTSQKDCIDRYTEVTLWIDNFLDRIK
jgi:hypothetical protein